MQTLTIRQAQILQVIKDFIREIGYPPTLQEIANRIDVKSKNAVFKHLVALERKGRIKRGNNISRGIQIVNNNHTDEIKLEIFAPGMTEEDRFIISRANTALFDIARAFGVSSDAVGFKCGRDEEGNLVVAYTIDKA